MERQLIAQIQLDPNYLFVDRVLQTKNSHKRKFIPIRDIINNITPDQNNNTIQKQPEQKKLKRINTLVKLVKKTNK